MKNKLGENLLFGIWGIATIATAGSLYFSEVLKYTPCTLCWYQRIFMYPIALIMTIGLLNKRVQPIQIIVLAVLGWGVAAYHYSIQLIPTIGANSFCSSGSCTGRYIDWYGFVTIPFMALTAFTLILIGCFSYIKKIKGDKNYA